MSLVSMLAGLNGALVQLIMASRIVYGMARRRLAPTSLARVSDRTQTPIRATILAVAVTLVFALWLPLTDLARITSALILIIYATVNLALLVIVTG